jgi:hypothetical protein
MILMKKTLLVATVAISLLGCQTLDNPPTPPGAILGSPAEHGWIAGCHTALNELGVKGYNATPLKSNTFDGKTWREMWQYGHRKCANWQKSKQS